MNTNKNVYIHNFWYVNNYGACLTAYALYKIVLDLGYNPILVDLSSYAENLAYLFKDFATKYFNTTSPIRNYTQILEIQKNNPICIVGSDQVFRPSLAPSLVDYLLLNHISSKSKKIAFSASFGVDKENFIIENTKEIIDKYKKSLQAFDFISTREKEGIEICKDIIDLDAEWIIDPVFMLKSSKFIELANNCKKDYSNCLASYYFKKDNAVNNIYKKFEKQCHNKIVELNDSGLSIEEWLKVIYDCKFLITNSFHGVCFAIIFNKPFICMSGFKNASTRFNSVFELLGIKNQCISNLAEILVKDCIFKIDYGKVNKRIEEERQKGLDFLKKSLEMPIGKQKEKEEVRTKYLEERILEIEKQANLKFQIKKELWNLWLVVFHKYLPNFIKNLIRKGRNFVHERHK
jgi:hypothetical protein